jgi:hypothetical protein
MAKDPSEKRDNFAQILGNFDNLSDGQAAGRCSSYCGRGTA